MDKFSRRPNRKARVQNTVLALSAFTFAGGCFGVLIAFGNAAIPWFFGLYAFCWTLGFLFWQQRFVRNYFRWRSRTRLQSQQGPGFSTLELAAIEQFLDRAGPQEAAARRHFEQAEVVSRYNSGAGGVTAIRSSQPWPWTKPATDNVSWFHIDQLNAVVGCQFWPGPAERLSILEIFAGDTNTAQLDWMTVTFRGADDGLPHPPAPTFAPIISEPRWVTWRPEP